MQVKQIIGTCKCLMIFKTLQLTVGLETNFMCTGSCSTPMANRHLGSSTYPLLLGAWRNHGVRSCPYTSITWPIARIKSRTFAYRVHRFIHHEKWTLYFSPSFLHSPTLPPLFFPNSLISLCLSLASSFWLSVKNAIGSTQWASLLLSQLW